VAVSNVELRVDAKSAVAQLNRASAATIKLDNAVRNMNGKLKDIRSKFAASGNAARKASNDFGNLAGTLAKAAVAYASFAAAQSAVRAGIQRIESERRISFLAKGYGEVEQLSKAAADASIRFGQSQTTANKALAGVYARLRPVGVSLEDIVSTYNGFNTAARISGATAVEAENAFTQLAQALGSGALRGDEFNSISEQVPGILTAISKETGVAQGKLRAYAAEGEITSEIVIKALKRIETEGVAQLEEALGGPSQAIADFQNAAEDVQVALTRDIVPQMAEVFKGLAELIVNLEGPIRFIGNVAAGTLNQINSLIIAATQPGAASARRDIKSGLLPLNVQGAEELFRGTGPGGKGLSGMREQSTLLGKLRGQDRKKVLLQLMQDRLAAMDAANQVDAPLLPAPDIKSLSPNGKKNGKGARAAKERADMSEAMFALEQKRQSLAFSNNELLKIEVDRLITVQQIMEANMLPRERTIALQESTNQALARGAEILKPIINGVAGLQKGAREAGAAFAQLAIDAQKMQQLYSSIGQTIQTGIVNSLTAAVEGTKSLAEVASDTLKSLASILLKFGLQTFLGGLGGGDPTNIFTKLFGGGMASGGTVKGGTSYLVGERGPELFTPGRSGSIAPNNSLGGATNIVVNVDASNADAKGGSAQSKQLGKAIGLAVQAELVKQKRPGGLLASR